jgi:glycosyltransferase involved in cell wall biosynthesis
MKVLLAHNFYQSSSPSGEDSVFRDEAALLRSKGVDVVTYEKHNDDIRGAVQRLWAAAGILWSQGTYRELRRLLKRERPELVHFHNIWYLISPSAYYACRDSGVPVVQTLHNFRMFCSNGLLMRDGSVCEDCIGTFPWRGAVNGCYRDSRLLSVPVAMTQTIHRTMGTWQKQVDAYITLTSFGKRKFLECGLPEEKLFVKPNFLAGPPELSYSHRDYGIFLGRISHEKGVDTLIAALKVLKDNRESSKIRIVGEGPLRGELEDQALREGLSGVEFTGRRSFQDCMCLLTGARFLVLPARCYENFPMVIREAFACGKPVIASRLGAMGEIVENGRTGLLFDPGDAKDLAAKMRWMTENEDARADMGRNARAEFEEKYTSERNFEMLMGIYEKAIGLQRKK